MIFYIDPINGDGDGSSTDKARREYTDLALSAGDSVLFKRGSFVRGWLDVKAGGNAEAPIVFGAYGEGQNPVFCGSVDVSDAADWKEIRANVWQYQHHIPDEACNFIFDGGRIGGTLRWEENLLCAQGDWYDNRIGSTCQHTPVEYEKVLLWSKGNPGEFYSHIECAVWGKRCMGRNVSYVEYSDLSFENSGVHGLSGGAHDVKISRCSFCFIGGAVWNRQLKIRFGNAIEFWDVGENIVIEDCFFNNIYDSCITQQGGSNCKPATRLVMCGNLFMNYGMGAYEGRDRMLVESEFSDNICYKAGGGFTGFGDTIPRKSEIYPQPMGHHIFMWRIPNATEGGGFEISGNIFYETTGAAVYSIISPEADAQMCLHNNHYFTSNEQLFTHIGGKNWKAESFGDYIKEYNDIGSTYGELDIWSYIHKWFADTAMSEDGVKLYTDTLPPHRYFIGSTERDSLRYKIGEEMIFKLTLVEEGRPISCPRFLYSCQGDDGEKSEGVLDGGESCTIKTSLKSAGYVHVICRAADENNRPLDGYDIFEGGACAGFDDIKQAVARPDDFDEFWDGVIARELDTVAPELIECVEFNSGDPGDIVYDIKIAAPGGMPVSGYLRMPRNAAEKSLPAVVSFMGYSITGAPVPNKANAIQFSVNPHGIPNGKDFDFYAKLANDGLNGFGLNREQNASPDTVYFKYMILRDLQALRYIKTRPEWNGEALSVVGGSMGAFQAVSATAHDGDVTRLDISVPWMCDLWGITVGRMRGWRPEIDNGIAYYDTVSQAINIKCPTYINAGLGDYVCPPSSVTALYHNISAKKELLMIQNRTHPYMPPKYSSYKMP